MAKFQNIFKRYEVKYMLTRKQYTQLRRIMDAYMKGDEFGKSTICNIYYDTPDYLLIRRSLDKPDYKEKIRLRTYGVANSETTAFAEIKKKFDGIVYKRRVSMKERDAMIFLNGGIDPLDNQISRELRFCLKRYRGLAPRVFLSYSREAFYGKEDHDFRITFDENILWRDYDVDLKKGIYGEAVLPQGMVLAEIKTIGGFPLWLVDFLSQNQLRKVSFSKYGAAYTQILARLQNQTRHSA